MAINRREPVVYNFGEERLREVPLPIPYSENQLNAAVYVESLVSLKWVEAKQERYENCT